VDITSLSGLITPLAVAYGGTGASSAAGSRAALGAAASGANTDITSLTGLSTALGTGFGGTGIKTAPTAAGQFLRSSAAGAWAITALQSSDIPNLSSSYIQNGTGVQIANMNISGAGTTLNASGGSTGVSGTGSTYGVYGYNSGSGGYGGYFNGGSGGTGVYATSAYTAVNGVAGGGNNLNYGVYGSSTSTSGVGVYGTGPSEGVWGQSNASSGTGVYGDAPYIGVWGNASGSTGYTYGVYASSNTGNANSYGVFGSGHYGVYGTTNNASGYGAFFYNSAGGTALYSNGPTTVGSNLTVTSNLTVYGTVSKGAGSFKIDHPLDPENKYLYHSFVESPDMKNIYDGVAQLDANGEAWITLPDWFAALNRDFRYQLTAIGAPGPNLYVAEEIANNHFKIAGGKALAKVSWQVTGIRQDAFANTNRIPVEQTKPEGERGKYLHPAAFGLSAERGINAQRSDGVSDGGRGR
jgi:hypothetical protein